MRKEVVGRYGKASKHARWAVLKKPSTLTPGQRQWVDQLQRDNSPLTEAYQIKEQLRVALTATECVGHARQLLNGVISWAQRAEYGAMRKLAASLVRVKAQVVNTLECGLTNARLEATNMHIRGLTKVAYGLHSPEALLARVAITRCDHRFAVQCRMSLNRAHYIVGRAHFRIYLRL